LNVPDLLKTLAADGGRTRVVVLSPCGTATQALETLRHGASGYVVKDAPTAELTAAVRAAADGQRFVSSPFSKWLIDAHAAPARLAASDPYDTLTIRERQVLQLAAEGLTNREIAERLAISRRTAETHRANLMRKLGLKNHKDVILFALKRGMGDRVIW
jgi:two-component system, NarL family, response regulator NreC